MAQSLIRLTGDPTLWVLLTDLLPKPFSVPVQHAGQTSQYFTGRDFRTTQRAYLALVEVLRDLYGSDEELEPAVISLLLTKSKNVTVPFDQYRTVSSQHFEQKRGGDDGPDRPPVTPPPPSPHGRALNPQYQLTASRKARLVQKLVSKG